MMNEEQTLRNKISANQFAAWELHLFLDTHPNNQDALTMQQDYRRKTEALMREYEDKYGPIRATKKDKSHWSWVNDPWPWEMEAN